MWRYSDGNDGIRRIDGNKNVQLYNRLKSKKKKIFILKTASRIKQCLQVKKQNFIYLKNVHRLPINLTELKVLCQIFKVW